jgi:glycosyltransferase-like protein LARGE
MTYADVHLVVDNYDRQFNNWRNIARLFARTDYVMMLDIDFYPCTDFRGLIRALNSTMLRKLDASRAAFVVPAFEYRDFQQGVRYTEFPTDKSVSTQKI